MSNGELHRIADNVLEDLFVPGKCCDAIPPITVLRRLDVVTVERPLRGRFATTVSDRCAMVEYEPDPDPRDTEQNPLQAEGGLEAFLRREARLAPQTLGTNRTA